MGRAVLIVCSIILLCASTNAVNLLTSEYTVDTVRLLSSTLKMGLVNLTFDEDLYKADTIDCAPSVFEAGRPDGITTCEDIYDPCGCDYTHANCGNFIGECTDATRSCNTDFCDTTKYTWIDLAAGVGHEVFVPMIGSKNPNYTDPTKQLLSFRYLNKNPCAGLKVRVEASDGNPGADYSWIEPYTEPVFYVNPPDRYIFEWRVSQETSFCPVDYGGYFDYYHTGTLFIGAFNDLTDCLTTVTVFAADVPKELPNNPSNPTEPINGGLFPIEPIIDGKVYENTFYTDGLTPTYYFYSFNITKCEVLSIRASCLVGYDVDITVNEGDNPYPYYDGPWIGARSGEDYLTIAVCPEEGEDYKIMFISVLLGQPFNNTFYRLTVTTAAPRYLLPIGTGYQYSRTFEYIGATALELPNGNTFACVDYVVLCDGYYNLWASPMPNAFFPRNVVVYDNAPTDITGNINFNVIDSVSAGNRTIMGIAFLGFTVNGNSGAPVNETQFYEASIIFRGLFVTEDYVPIMGKHAMKKSVANCDYDTFNVIKSDLTSRLNNVLDQETYAGVVTARAYMDVATQFNAWTQCQDMAAGFAPMITVEEEILTDGCTYLVGTDEYMHDPCCNTFLGFSECCLPTMKKTSKTAYAGHTNIDQMDAKCANPDCTIDIATSFSDVYSNIDSCSAPSKEVFDNDKAVFAFIRHCTNVVFDNNTVCMDNSDCPVAGSYCDLYTHICNVPADYLEEVYAKCVIENVGGSMKYSLINALLLPSTASDTEIAAAYRKKLTDNDCVLRGTSDFDLSIRTSYQVTTYPPNCFDSANGFCEYGQVCKDQSCDIPVTVCAQICPEQWTWVPTPIKDNATCLGLAQTCTYGSGTGPCVNHADDPTACDADAACTAAPASYCGYCLNPNYCPDTALDVATCGQTTACVHPDGTFGAEAPADCEAIAECVPADYAVPCADCDTKEGCEQNGYCSDADYWFLPPTGTCLHKGLEQPTYANYPFCVQTYPTPIGCFDGANNQTACEEEGGIWYVPATTEAECLSTMACKDFGDATYIGIFFNRVFSYKSEAECKKCGLEWTNVFTWTPSTWVTGKSVTPEVMAPVLQPTYEYKSVMDYTEVMDVFLVIVQNISVTSYQAEALCRFNKLESSLTNLACDCTPSGQANGNCYTTSPQILDTLVRPCVGEDAPVTFTTTNAVLTFPTDSVATGCVEILVYDLAASIFRGAEPIRLAAYFASFQTVDLYAVKNPSGGTIGQVLGDGIVMDSEGNAANAEICVGLSLTATNNAYNVYDFASINDDYTEFTPLEVNPTVKDGRMCGVVQVPKGKSSLIPIRRLKDWQDVKAQFFSKTAFALLTTLGVFYVVLAAFAFFQVVGVLFFALIGKIKAFQVSNIITFSIFVFTLIRSVYFFLVPGGSLSSGGSVAEYILIVFPTFPYFTAFSCVPLVWAILTTGAVKRGGNTAKIFKVVGIINAILYILFIVIVVVFTETKEILSSDCLGTHTETATISGPQVAISIVYSVVISVVSLSIAVAFLFFGRRVAVIAQTDEIVKKTYKMACVCAVGFGLNCIFILIITGARLYNIGFSFAGLVISELIPSLFMLLNFGAFDLLKKLIYESLGLKYTTASAVVTASATTSTASNSSTAGASSSVSASSSASSASSSTAD